MATGDLSGGTEIGTLNALESINAQLKNVLSIVEGGFITINDALASILEKLVLADDTKGVSERDAVTQEIQRLGAEIDSVVQQTPFNGVILMVNTMTSPVGLDGIDADVYRLSQVLHSAARLVSTLTADSQALAGAPITTLQFAIDTISGVLQSAGSAIERLRVRADSLSTAELNLRAARSRITDADLAAEQLTSSKRQASHAERGALAAGHVGRHD